MKILTAVDDSRYSEIAVALVKALKLGEKADVTLMTVIPEHVFLGGHTLVDLPAHATALKTQLWKAKEERASQLLVKLSKSYGTREPKVETMVHSGRPADEIIKACRSIRADLLVVGFKGTTDAPEFFLGSVAHKVIRYAPCSVLAAKGEGKAIRRVLVPFDGSKYSDEVVQFLMQIPLPRHTEVLLMTVLQAFAPAFVKAYTLDLERDQQIIAEFQEAEEEAAKQLMTKAENRLRKGGYEVSTIVARGDPSQEILRKSASRNVDLVAIGAKGLTGIRDFLLGSVAERVARHVRTSVLIVRPPKK